MKRFKENIISLIFRHVVLFILLFATDCGILLGNDTVNFALMADLHVNPGSASDSSLNMLVDEINKSGVDFTVVAGDLTNMGSDEELMAVKKALDRLTMPCYVLPGNHETNWSESAGLTFNRLWKNDRFLFKYNGFLFVGLNTGPFMKMGDGHVKQEDLEWLKRSLAVQKSDSSRLILISHYPLSDGLDNWYDVTDVIKPYECCVVFCGHGHRLSLHNFDGIPGIMGRTALAGNNSGPGYSIVTLRNDSVMVWNKEFSLEPGKPAIALNYTNSDIIRNLPVSVRPDFSVNKLYDNIRITVALNDSASIFTGPCLVIDSLLVYGNSVGWIKAINTRSGKMQWQFHVTGPVYSTPVAVKGVLVAGTVDGNLIGISAEKGEQLWALITGKPFLAEGIAEDEFVYIGGGDRTFYKIDPLNGKVVWQFNRVEGLIQGKPAICGTSVVFGAWDRHLYCLDKNTGSLRWKWNNGRPQILYSPGNISPVCSDGKVFIVAPDRFMTAIDLNTGNEVWRTNRHMVRESMGSSPDGSLVLAKLMNDTVIAVSASGSVPETLWAINAGFGYEHNPCPVTATDKAVFVATRNGIVIAIDPEGKKVDWKYKAGNSSVNKVIADSDGTTWITLTEGRILGIRTTKEQ